MKMKYREFRVTPGLVGFKVIVGCSELYFTDAKKMGKEIMRYLNNPDKVEKEYVKLSGGTTPPVAPETSHFSSESTWTFAPVDPPGSGVNQHQQPERNDK
jgi:hypothetical protein